MKNYNLYSTAGQITALVTENKRFYNAAQTAREIMRKDKSIEQVGFLYSNTPTPRLEMMGGELCINGTLAAGSMICENKKVTSATFPTSGLNTAVRVIKNNSVYSLEIPDSIILEQSEEYVELQGICYFVEQGLRPTKKLSRDEQLKLQSFGLAKKAAGFIFYEGNNIQPVIYVSRTASLVWENACGSGSLAFSLVTGITNVLQPSGETICITKNNDTLTISASVKEIL